MITLPTKDQCYAVKIAYDRAVLRHEAELERALGPYQYYRVMSIVLLHYTVSHEHHLMSTNHQHFVNMYITSPSLRDPAPFLYFFHWSRHDKASRNLHTVTRHLLVNEPCHHWTFDVVDITGQLDTHAPKHFKCGEINTEHSIIVDAESGSGQDYFLFGRQ